jgi:hypothetical protein
MYWNNRESNDRTAFEIAYCLIPYPRTPAMAAGLTDHVWSIKEIVRLIHEH